MTAEEEENILTALAYQLFIETLKTVLYDIASRIVIINASFKTRLVQRAGSILCIRCWKKAVAFRWKDYYRRFTLTNFGLMIVKLQPCYETNENGLRYAVYARERACVCVYM